MSARRPTRPCADPRVRVATMPCPPMPASKEMPSSVSLSCTKAAVAFSWRDSSGCACKCWRHAVSFWCSSGVKAGISQLVCRHRHHSRITAACIKRQRMPRVCCTRGIRWRLMQAAVIRLWCRCRHTSCEIPALTPELHQKLTAWRQHLHAHPELSLQEKATAAFVQDKLTELGIGFEAGIGGHGIVATLSRGHAQGRVGLRADMDALPITEDTGLAYASQNPGVMHACGHDGHTASLLGAAALLAADTSWSGTVDFIFQPAEEGYGGSRAMVAAGLFERFPMERVFGFHNWPGLEAGTIAVHDGVVMASGGRISIAIDGHAGHAGMPHLTRDPVMAAGHLIVALQSI